MSPTVITAKNSGLVKQVELTLAQLRLGGFQRRAVRGEDVPQVTTDLASRGRPVIGLTGDDLLEEWLAAGNALDERIVRSKRPWNDPSAIFGGPALCLIGSPQEKLDGPKRIAICSKYRYLAERYILGLEDRGIEVDRVYLSGALENVQLLGLADFIIDIVVTGSTMREAGLAVREVISRSDLAVLEART